MASDNKPLLPNQRPVGLDGEANIGLSDKYNEKITDINGWLLTATVTGTDGVPVAGTAVQTDKPGCSEPIIILTPAQVAVAGDLIFNIKGTNESGKTVFFKTCIEIVD